VISLGWRRPHQRDAPAGGYDPTQPCNVILYCPEVLGERNFVAQPADAGTDTSTGTTTDAATD
jgi:hypothetical protein